MSDHPYKKEEVFFHSIAHTILTFVKENRKKAVVAKYKTEGSELNYATQIDVECENLIVAEIATRFPKDKIIAEENFSDQKVSDEGRFWAIDPICGTGNLARGLTIFCANIALVENGKIVAACVMDHSTSEYFWSVGDKTLYIGEELFEPSQKKTGVVIDLDLGPLPVCTEEQKKKHLQLVSNIILKTNYDTTSLNTSLAFLYVALGKKDGYISPYNNLWDIGAANFLIQEAGGVVTNLAGKSWTIYDPNCIAARTKEIHDRLMSLI